MLKNYFKVAIRNLLRHKVYSSINIAGLALGIACCLLLSLYIQDELSVDTHHNRLDDLYRITTQFESNRGLNKMGTSSPPIAMTMWDELSEIESAVRVLNPPGVAQNLIKYGENIFYESDGFIADSTLFDVFTYELTEGNPRKALTEANSVVISETLARKLFGNEPALDKSISISQGAPEANYVITGVFKENNKSHIHANFFTSMTSGGWGEYLRTSPGASQEWAGQNFVPAYFKLRPGHDRATLEKKMNEVLVKYGAEDMKAMGMKKTLGLEPLRDIYLRSDVDNSPRITYVYVIGSIAAFILLIACINFMNLSTAKATKRAAEIGIRKVMGAFRSSLIQQIMGEAMIIVVISILLSIILVQGTLPFFNQLTGKSISFGTENIGYLAACLAVIAIITGLVAGSYPAFYLSSFQPAQVLKGKFGVGNATGWLRQSLVVFQFMIAIALVCGMIIVSRQLNYLQEKDLGFNSESKIVLPLRTQEAQQKYSSLKKQLENYSAIESISAAEYIPGSPIYSDMMFYSDGGTMDDGVLNRRNTVDAGYMELLDIPLIAGRKFTNNRAMDSDNKVIVNRASAKKFGFEPEKIVGEKLYFDWQGQKYTFEVIGVMEDYHQNTLKEEINPTMFEMARGDSSFAYLIASVKLQDHKQTISYLESTWKELINDTPFEFSFLDESIQRQYDEDKKVSSVITSFTVIAMIICCLGLYGLSSYMAERRFKEIGVRKVMGASVGQIVTLLSKEFTKLVLIAFVIATPLAWYGMKQWLSGFAYSTPMGWQVFAYAGAGALAIALLTVSFESIRAATTNPVESLRNE